MVLKDRKMMLYEIANILKISEGGSFTTLYENLDIDDSERCSECEIKKISCIGM